MCFHERMTMVGTWGSNPLGTLWGAVHNALWGLSPKMEQTRDGRLHLTLSLAG